MITILNFNNIAIKPWFGYREELFTRAKKLMNSQFKTRNSKAFMWRFERRFESTSSIELFTTLSWPNTKVNLSCVYSILYGLKSKVKRSCEQQAQQQCQISEQRRRKTREMYQSRRIWRHKRTHKSQQSTKLTLESISSWPVAAMFISLANGIHGSQTSHNTIKISSPLTFQENC